MTMSKSYTFCKALLFKNNKRKGTITMTDMKMYICVNLNKEDVNIAIQKWEGSAST